MVSVSDEPVAVPPPSRSGIEKRGIERVPDDERHGRPRHLGFLWTGVVLNVQVVVYGALLVSFGLNWWQCLLAIVLGNLTWLVTGVASLAGPAAGTTTFAVSRAAFGHHGNRPIALFNWTMQVGYEVLDLVLMALAATALLDLAGVHVNGPGKAALVLALAVVQSVLPLIGHAAITRALHLLVVPFAALFCVLAWLTAGRLDHAATAPAGWVAFLGGVALTASGSGLGWTANAPDYSRYLPKDTSKRGIVAAVTLGGAVPQMLLMVVGACAALVVPAANDPVSGLPNAYPLWFAVPYLVFVIAQMTALNAIDLYSSGVTLQALGVPIGRWQAVVLDGVICAAIGLAVVYSGDFNTVLSDFLLFMIIWFAPWAAIFVTDLVLRRARYDSADLHGGRPWNRHGILAQLGGMAAAALWINTSVYVGPLAKAAGGLDLSVPAGLLVGGGLYLLLARTSVRAATEGTTA
ncbi:Permease for cytosine/purines, uracil, thiamine, allantoin [Actinomadura rubteroloni]|uniref:Permease for cytosine/purines, uracil, thiamine, allantoin n=1 Tax=Actinomadura rubteroloni TaxID=1926885 RepID=A0A2P4UM77_9ACTN|nr:cytosine permease [Actinomadura rubteroloni]POM26153.1 Permease for cytosine/purines, uracil, thiamine, allantoin [Actinomadura rubteroloni]